MVGNVRLDSKPVVLSLFVNGQESADDRDQRDQDVAVVGQNALNAQNLQQQGVPPGASRCVRLSEEEGAKLILEMLQEVRKLRQEQEQEVAELKSNTVRLEQTVAKLENSTDEIEKKCQENKDSVQKLEKGNAELEMARIEFSDKIREIKDTLDSSEKKCNEAFKKLEVYNDEKKLESEKINDCNQKIQKLKHDLLQSKTETKKQIDQDLDTCRKSIDELKQKINRFAIEQQEESVRSYDESADVGISFLNDGVNESLEKDKNEALPTELPKKNISCIRSFFNKFCCFFFSIVRRIKLFFS